MHTTDERWSGWLSTPIDTSKVLCFLALVGVGLASNILKFEIFFNIDILFGSIFTLIVLQAFGILPGILAAAAISSYTYVLWNHPYAIIIQIAEVMVVGWAYSRRHFGLIVVDVFYWLCCGMPLVVLFYKGWMNVSWDGVTIIMVKQAVNGIVNTLLARLLFMGFSVRFRYAEISIRDIVHTSSVFFLLAPILLLIGIESRQDITDTEFRIRTSLLEQTETFKQDIDSWISDRKQTIEHLARYASEKPFDQTEIAVRLLVEAENLFLSIALIDMEGTIQVAAPATDESGKPLVGKRIPARPWFSRIQTGMLQAAQLHIFKDEALRSSSAHVAAIVSPVQIDNRVVGYIEGILNVAHIHRHLMHNGSHLVDYVCLTSSNGHILHSNFPSFLDPNATDPQNGTLQHITESLRMWTPKMPRNTSIMERWAKTFYIATGTIDDSNSWNLILAKSLLTERKALYTKYSIRMSMIFGFLLLALATGEWISRRFIVIFDQLCSLTSLLPDLLNEKSEVDIKRYRPETMITENRIVIDNLEKIFPIVAAQYRDARQTSEALRKRTQELWEANQAQQIEIEARQKAESLLENLIAEKEVLLREIHHRVKNNLAAIIALIDLHTQKTVDTTWRLSLMELCTRIRSMALVHEQLYHSENISSIDFHRYLESLVQSIVASYDQRSRVLVRVDARDVRMGLDEAVPCGLIVTELVTNAFKYAFPQAGLSTTQTPTIEVVARRDGDFYRLSVSDNGIGLPKHPDWKHIDSLGLLLIKMLGQHQLRGTIEMDLSSGTTIRVIFPARKAVKRDPPSAG